MFVLNLILAASSLLPLSASSATDGEGDVWLTDLAPALEVARENDKELFVYFTGSDWCKYCILLDREVFGADYLDKLAEKYVLVKLDFPDPQGEVYRAMSKDLLRRNYAHKADFSVAGQPVILIMSPDRWVAGRLGYMPGGVPAFERQLQGVESGLDDVMGAYAALHGKGDTAPKEQLAAAYRLNEHPFLRLEDKQRIIEVVKAHDPDDSKFVLAYAAIDEFIATHLMRRNAPGQPDWASIETVLVELAERLPSVEGVAEFHAYRAMSSAWLGNDEASDASVERARALGMSARMGQWLQGHLTAARSGR